MTMQIKFTQELKDKWIEALRSGEYDQTTGTLRDDNGFCCLGVLCDVIDPNGWTTKEDFNHRCETELVGDEDWHIHGHAVYGKEFSRKCDVNTHKYAYREDGYDLLPIDFTNLSKRNDGIDEFHKHDFIEIADWIEENVPAQG